MDMKPDQKEFPWERGGGLTGHWLKKAFFAMRRQSETRLRAKGLTIAQWQALGIIYYREGITHTELEHALSIEASSITSLITGMVKKGWVERRQDSRDARVKRIFLTPAGVAMIEPSMEINKIVEDKMLGGLTQQEIDDLRRTLQKMIKNLEE